MNQNNLYAVNNDEKQVIFISINGLYLTVLKTYNFEDFFECGYSKREMA